MPKKSVPRPCACTSIKKLSRLLGRVYDAALATSPINVTQLAILRCIDRSKRQPLTHVAEELEMDRSSLYRALDPMVRDEWLKIAAGTDARSLTAIITYKGYNSSKMQENNGNKCRPEWSNGLADANGPPLWRK